jgi:hypothetical protein
VQHCSRFLFFLAAACSALALLSGSAGATTPQNEKIPPSEFGCRLCHAGSEVRADWVPEPVSRDQLTSFGQDWQDLAQEPDLRAWAEMAPLNSDGDGCTNGYELGDPRGEYLNPGTEPAHALGDVLDPNREDCLLPLDEQAWGTLKALFGEQ